jgi:hypothetical protein
MAANSDDIYSLTKFVERTFSELKKKIASSTNDILWASTEQRDLLMELTTLSDGKQDAVVRDSFALLAMNMENKKSEILELKGLVMMHCTDLDRTFLTGKFYGQDYKIKCHIVNMIMWWIMVTTECDKYETKVAIDSYFQKLKEILAKVKDHHKNLNLAKNDIKSSVVKINAVRSKEAEDEVKYKENYKKQKLMAAEEDNMGDQYMENSSTRLKASHAVKLIELHAKANKDIADLEIKIDELITKANTLEDKIYRLMQKPSESIKFSYFEHKTWTPWLTGKLYPVSSRL